MGKKKESEVTESSCTNCGSKGHNVLHCPDLQQTNPLDK